MDVDIVPSPTKQVHEEEEQFEEIDTSDINKHKMDNVSLKGVKKQSRTNSPSPSIPPGSRTNMTRDQIKYCGAIMRNLKKHRDAAPFLHPVDYIKLNVPDYPKVIKYPMDLTTVDQKLNTGEYENVEEFINDIRLVFNNCYKFNGPEAMISMLCQNVESAFEKSLRQMPPSRGATPPVRSMSPYDENDGDKVKRRKKNPPANNNKPTVNTATNINSSTYNFSSNHTSPTTPYNNNGRRYSSLTADQDRPKREIHPPPSKDYPEPMTKRKNPRKNDLQMKFCLSTLRELKKSKYRDINYPFLQPVDVVALNIPDYVNIIKHPMDLATIERKLTEGDYQEPEQFEQDIRLMFNNCYTYNPPTLPVHKMARELEKAFDEKWAQKPTTPVPTPIIDDHQVEEFDEVIVSRKGQSRRQQQQQQQQQQQHEENEEESDDDEDNERDQKIAELERHIATISQQIATIKSLKKKKSTDKQPIRRTQANKPVSTKEKKALTAPVKEKRKRVTKKKEPTATGGTSIPAHKTTAASSSVGLREELPEFTFDQKKDLSERINNLSGDRLNTVVSIIQSSMPNLDGQGQEEIVLDIDSLDRQTLHRLHEFVTGESLITTAKKTASSASASPSSKRPRTHYSERDADHNESSSESDSDSSSGSDSDDSGSSSD